MGNQTSAVSSVKLRLIDLTFIDKGSPIGNFLRSKSECRPSPRTYKLEWGICKFEYTLGWQQPSQSHGFLELLALLALLVFDIAIISIISTTVGLIFSSLYDITAVPTEIIIGVFALVVYVVILGINPILYNKIGCN